jgi:hypothetical protein
VSFDPRVAYGGFAEVPNAGYPAGWNIPLSLTPIGTTRSLDTVHFSVASIVTTPLLGIQLNQE